MYILLVKIIYWNSEFFNKIYLKIIYLFLSLLSVKQY